MNVINKTQQTVAMLKLNGIQDEEIAKNLNIPLSEVKSILSLKHIQTYINEIEARDIEIQMRKYALEKVYKLLPKLIETLGERIEKTNANQGLKMTDVKLLEILMKELPKVHSEQMQKIINITQNFFQQNNYNERNENDIMTLISKIPSYKQDMFWKEVENLIQKYITTDTKQIKQQINEQQYQRIP